LTAADLKTSSQNLPCGIHSHKECNTLTKINQKPI